MRRGTSAIAAMVMAILIAVTAIVVVVVVVVMVMVMHYDTTHDNRRTDIVVGPPGHVAVAVIVVVRRIVATGRIRDPDTRALTAAKTRERGSSNDRQFAEATRKAPRTQLYAHHLGTCAL